MSLRVGFDETVLGLDASGTARAVRALAAELARREEVDLVRLAHRPPRAASSRLLAGLDRELRWYRGGLGRAAARQGVDLLHCPAAIGPTRGRVPRVVTVNDVLALEHPGWFTRANALQQRLVLPGLVRGAAAVIVPSSATADAVRRRLRVDPVRLHVVPYGVDPRFAPGAVDPAVAERFGVRAPYAITVATLQPRKNLGLALDMQALLAARGAGVQLVVVGGHGWGDDAVLQAAAARGAGEVVVTGRVEDTELVSLLRGASCLVHPTVFEGFGFPPLEALACGTPVVAVDGGSVPEVLAGTGRLVPPDRPDLLAAAVLDVVAGGPQVEDQRARGLARAAELTWSATADGVLQVYRAVAGAGPR